jgi:hypothetical protein
LGFRDADVNSVLKRIETESSEELANSKGLKPEELVRRALQQLR